MFGIIFRDKPEADFNQIPYNQNPNNAKQKKLSAPFKFS